MQVRGSQDGYSDKFTMASYGNCKFQQSSISGNMISMARLLFGL